MNEPSSPTGFVAPEPSELAPLFPGYDIHDLIATGGMGAVYRAVQKSLDRTVALKILPMEFSEDAEFCAGFAAEAKAMARLNHPNLISVYDFGSVNGMLFIVMEFVPGKSIYHSANGVAIDPLVVIRLVTGICHGLAHAHENGILHRDIKPSNILLTTNAEPKIGDFGLARPIERKSEAGEMIFGTPGYTAPEVMEAPQSVDHRADLFSVGVLLHELLTGKLPKADERSASMISGCDIQFDPIIRRAIDPETANRYTSAAEIASDLQSIASSPVTGPMAKAGATPSGRAPRPAAPRHAPATQARRKLINVSWIGPVIALAVIGYCIHTFLTREPKMIVIVDQAASSSTAANAKEISESKEIPDSNVSLAPISRLPAPDVPPVVAPKRDGNMTSDKMTPFEYGLFVKGKPEAWSIGKDGSVAGTLSHAGMADACRISGLPFPAEFRLHIARKGWLGWVPCDGGISSGNGQTIEAIQFRFPAGMPDRFKLYGRVHVEGIGWLKTLPIESFTVLGTTKCHWSLSAIQMASKVGEVGSEMDLVERTDAALNLLLPPNSPPVPKAGLNMNVDSGIGRWIFDSASDEFTILPDGTARPETRSLGKWTCLNSNQSLKVYQINWSNGRWVDTMTLSCDGSLMKGQNQTGSKLIFARVDGLSQIRDGAGKAQQAGPNLDSIDSLVGRNMSGTWNDATDNKLNNPPVPHGDRIWIQAGTGKTINATLVGKSPDNSKVTLMITGSKKAITAASDTFSPKDREYISRWEPPSQKRIASSPASREVKGEEPPQGLVLPPPTVLEQGKGGFGIQIDELGQILKPYAVPENDLAAHPEMTIYSGPSPSGGGDCTITYLMKRDKAVELLLGRAGLSLKLKAVAPGFPPGLSIYNYDRKFWDYDHLTLVVDAADQVVTLQFKSDTKAFGYLDGKWPYFNFRTLNFINLKVADGVRIQVRGRKDGNEPVVVNSDHRRLNETVTWFVPKPLVRLILFNVQEKQKTGRR